MVYSILKQRERFVIRYGCIKFNIMIFKKFSSKANIRGTPGALYYRRFLHGVHLPANQRRLLPLSTDPIGWDVYAM